MPTWRASSEALTRGSALSSPSNRTFTSSSNDFPSGSPCCGLGALGETIRAFTRSMMPSVAVDCLRQ